MVIPILLVLSVGLGGDDVAGARAAANHARSLLGSGRPAEALEEARRATALDPRNADGDLLAGFALLDTGEPEEALTSFRRALLRKPDSIEARGGLAMSYGALGDPRAEKEFAAIIGSFPSHPRYRHRYAEYLWLTGEAEKGNRQMERAIALAPSDPLLRFVYGKKLHEEGRFLDAAREIRRARTAGVRDPSLQFLLGSAELENGHFAEAERELRQGIAAEPSHSEARQLLGKVLLLTGRPDEASRELALAAELDPGSAQIQLDIGRAAEAQGDFAAAEAAYRRALSLQANLSRGHYLLGALLSRQRRVEEARREMGIYEKAYEEEQSILFRHTSLRVEINLGLRELREGRLEEALARFALHPSDAEALRWAATALSLLGRHAEAVAALRRAVELAPNDRRLRYELARELQGDRSS